MKSITMKLSPLNLTILTFLTTAAIASEQKTEILAPIVVTASGSSQEFRDAPASISVINQEQLKKTSILSVRKCFTRYSWRKFKR